MNIPSLTSTADSTALVMSWRPQQRGAPAATPATSAITFADERGRTVCRIAVQRTADGNLLSTVCSCPDYERYGSCIHVWAASIVFALFARYKMIVASLRIRWDRLDA